MVSMSKGDRTVLGGLVGAMILGVGGSLAVASSCLDRDRAHRNQDHAGFPEDKSARTSAGGIPGEGADAAVGTTNVTAAELPPAGAAAATTNAPPVEPNADAPPPAPYTNRLEPVETTRAAPVPAATPVPSPAPTSSSNAAPAADAGATTPGSAADAGTSMRDAGATTTTSAIGARPFATEPTDPYAASGFETNREAGAGPFTTEW